jgi:beta-N-acetylhexosaminidase
VTRLSGAPCCSAEEMGKHSSSFVRDQGKATARNLRDVGVNVDLAPVLDVARPGSAIGDQDRAFGDSAKRVTAKGNAFASGLEDKGVAATGKHFPGLGAAPADTDFHTQRIHLSKSRLRKTDERPYHRFDRIPGSMVMLSTAIYPAFDGHHPAALSHRVATRELRDHVGFGGVSITDALDTVSAHDFGGTGKLARAGAKAGADLLLFTGGKDGARATEVLKRALKAGKISRSSFETSARRVLDLRDSLAH